MVRVREIVRGAVTRFAPTVAGVMALMMFPLVVSAPEGFRLAGLAMTAGEILGLTVGYTASLWTVRRWLRPDAAVAGRRANVAAFGSILGLLATSMVVQGVSLPRAFGFSVLAGGAVTLALYFPWLTRPAATAGTSALSDDRSPVMLGAGDEPSWAQANEREPALAPRQAPRS